MAAIVERIILDQMGANHLDEVMGIEERVYTMPWRKSSFENEMSNPNSYYIIAMADNQVVGYAGEWLIIDEGHITTIAVDPNKQGRRIGEQLLIALIEKACQMGMERISLEVRQSNEIAQKLYKKYGFFPITLRKGYYPDNKEDAIVMWSDNIQKDEYTKKMRQYKAELGLM